MISDQHFIPHGGIGSFAKSFYEMCESLNWRCDFILDKKPRESVLRTHLQNAKFYYPENELNYSTHQNTFVFSDSINFEKVINFRTALLNAFSENLYDMVVVNTPEAGPAVFVTDINKYIPVVFYTHNENIVFMDSKKSDVFNDAFDDFTKTMMRWNIHIGTQSQKNADTICANLGKPASVLPMRVPELGLLRDNDWHLKDGVLFIGRFEPRKNPEEFIRVIAETGLKAKVLTNANGAEKFKKAFKKAGVSNYEIKASIIGEEKVHFIKSAKLAYHPSKLESYGFSAFESLHSCPTLALEEFDWYKAFDDIIAVDRDNVAEKLLELFNTAETTYGSTLDHMKTINDNISLSWKDFMAGNQQYGSSQVTKVVELIQKKQWSVRTLIFDGLERKNIAVEDIHSLLSKRHLFKTYYTLDETYVSMVEFTEPDKDIFGELFS